MRQRIIETSREQTILVTKRDNGALRVPTVCKLKTHSDKLQASIRSTVCSVGRSVGRATWPAAACNTRGTSVALKVKDQSVAAIVSWHCATNTDLFMVPKR